MVAPSYAKDAYEEAADTPEMLRFLRSRWSVEMTE